MKHLRREAWVTWVDKIRIIQKSEKEKRHRCRKVRERRLYHDEITLSKDLSRLFQVPSAWDLCNGRHWRPWLKIERTPQCTFPPQRIFMHVHLHIVIQFYWDEGWCRQAPFSLPIFALPIFALPFSLSGAVQRGVCFPRRDAVPCCHRVVSTVVSTAVRHRGAAPLSHVISATAC